MRYFLLLVLFICTQSMIFAQNKTINGYVTDAYSGESIRGVRVSTDDGKRSTTNDYGYYSLTYSEAASSVTFSVDGYEDETMDLPVEQTRLDIILFATDTHVELQSVVVQASMQNKVSDVNMGVEKLAIKTLNQVPVLLGERDLIKSIQLLPGVRSLGDGQSGITVRGGNIDQNLILLDDAPVYNAAHLLGFFSTFNSDAVKDVTLYKGTAPAQFGGRISSVLDVRMKDGNNRHHSVSGGLGLIASRLNVEGPIQQGKSSYLISGRRTYADMFLQLTEEFKGNKLYFYDLNAKLNFELSDKERLFVSGYFGRDVLSIGDVFGINWGNATTTARYNRIWNDKLFSNTTFVFSDFDFRIDIKSTAPNFSIVSSIRDFSLRHEFQYYANARNEMRMGVSTIHHSNVTGGIVGLVGLEDTNEKRYGLESAAYFTNQYKPSDKFQIEYGLRLSHFGVLPGGNYYNFDSAGEVIDTIAGGSGFVASYFNLEPRLAMNYILRQDQSIKLSYTRNTQHIHLVSNSVAASPSDRWIMNTNYIRPQIGDQISLGYFRNLQNMRYDFALETYYKKMQNQADFKDAANEQDLIIERQLVFGEGRAYGVEMLLRKNQGKLTGWLGYNLSKSERRIDGVNNDNWYPARQDRTHDLAIVSNYALTPKLSLGAVFVLQTGNAVTFPVARYEMEGQEAYYYTERNGYRMPLYHRADVSLTWTLRQTERRLSELVFGVYNLYGRENPFIINFGRDESVANRTVVTQFALFKYVPSISWNFKF
ncbi:MAG: TonB-dependent receptor [Weeksellaceae bacterium]|nr:TonB-dependent receptor [Weeksellaceae bacterium]